MIELCNNTASAPFIPVLTKSDKMSNNQRNKAIAAVNHQMMKGVEALAVSSKDIQGFDKLSKAIIEFTSV